jgi:hypothetical protein
MGHSADEPGAPGAPTRGDADADPTAEASTGPRSAPLTSEDELWYHSNAAIAVVAIDVLVLLVFAAGTTALVKGMLGTTLGLSGSRAMAVSVPWEVYAFGVLGAFGYVFTALLRDFDRTANKVFQYQFRVPAALPLAAGVFLLSGQILGGGSTDALENNQTLLASLAFVSGLYVNLAYERLSALADRLLRNDDGAAGGATGEAEVDGEDDASTDTAERTTRAEESSDTTATDASGTAG